MSALAAFLTATGTSKPTAAAMFLGAYAQDPLPVGGRITPWSGSCSPRTQAWLSDSATNTPSHMLDEPEWAEVMSADKGKAGHDRARNFTQLPGHVLARQARQALSGCPSRLSNATSSSAESLRHMLNLPGAGEEASSGTSRLTSFESPQQHGLGSLGQRVSHSLQLQGYGPASKQGDASWIRTSDWCKGACAMNLEGARQYGFWLTFRDAGLERSFATHYGRQAWAVSFS